MPQPVASPISAADSIESVDRRRWQSEIEPRVARFVSEAGPHLRRRRVRIGPAVIEYVGDDEFTEATFTANWPPAARDEPCTAYFYHFTRSATVARQEARAHACDAAASASLDAAVTISRDAGRALVVGPVGYDAIRSACIQLAAGKAQRSARTGAKRSPGSAAARWLLECAAVEMQRSDGATRAVALVGPHGAGKSSHAFGLARDGVANAWAGDGLAKLTRGDESWLLETAERGWWLPASLVTHFPSLVPFVAAAARGRIELPASVAAELDSCRDAGDFVRCVESARLSESHVAELTATLARSREHLLLEPQAVFGTDRCHDRLPLTDVVLLLREHDSSELVRTLDTNEFMSRASAAMANSAAPADSWAGNIPRSALAQLARGHAPRSAMLNTRLPFTLTQLCLRYLLDGRCDAARLIQPRDAAPLESVLHAMHVSVERIERAAGDSPELHFRHGARRVVLLAIEQRGECREAVAVDPLAAGFATIRAVWPNQIADFFSRGAAIHLRALFGECRNRL